jgi:hypothetical protein
VGAGPAARTHTCLTSAASSRPPAQHGARSTAPSRPSRFARPAARWTRARTPCSSRWRSPLASRCRAASLTARRSMTTRLCVPRWPCFRRVPTHG